MAKEKKSYIYVPDLAESDLHPGYSFIATLGYSIEEAVKESEWEHVCDGIVLELGKVVAIIKQPEVEYVIEKVATKNTTKKTVKK